MNRWLRVLFIGDNDADAALLSGVLKKNDCDIVSERVNSPEQLRDAVLHGTWHLVLSDYAMAAFHALDALRICQENGLDAPFIVVSDVADEEIVVKAIRAGASDYLLKENLTRLPLAVERSLKEAREHRKHKEAEAALRGSEEMFRTLSVSSPVGIYMADTQGREIYTNPRWREIFGLTLMQSVGDGWLNGVHPEDRETVQSAWSAYVAGGGEFEMEFRIRRRNGTVRWVHSRAVPRRSDTGEVLEHIGTVQDITERKGVEQALVESENRFRRLIEDSPEAIFVEDTLGTVLEANPAACRLHGLSREQLVGINVLELVPPEYRAEAAREFPKWFTGELTRCERFSYTADGRSVAVDLQGRCIEYQGRPAVLLHVRDVTERKRLEQQLRQAQKMDALGQMASGVAHDINNSLACILGFSELLLSHPSNIEDKKKVAELLQLINVAARDAGDVVHRLREFYRKRDVATQLCSMDLNEIVRNAIALSEPCWNTQARAAGVTVRVNINPGEVPPIVGDPAELREALMNLILNAVDALTQDGAITLRTRVENGSAVVEVSDTGAGMTEEVRQRCLEPFFTTKGERGTGMGLPMVYGVVQRHQGSIDIHSAPGEGTTVALRLPRHTASGSKTETTNMATPQNLRMLVVEDEPTLQEILVAYLVEDGHFVETAEDGVRGLEKFKAGRFDVVITDQVMPRMNGLEMAVAIRELSPRQPVLVVTGHGETIENVNDQVLPVNLVLSKPISISTLRDAVAKVTTRIERP